MSLYPTSGPVGQSPVQEPLPLVPLQVSSKEEAKLIEKLRNLPSDSMNEGRQFKLTDACGADDTTYFNPKYKNTFTVEEHSSSFGDLKNPEQFKTWLLEADARSGARPYIAIFSPGDPVTASPRCTMIPSP